MEAAAVCEECLRGRHIECSGEAWDKTTDKIVVCECDDRKCTG